MYTRLHIKNRTANSSGATPESPNNDARAYRRARKNRSVPGRARGAALACMVALALVCAVGIQSDLFAPSGALPSGDHRQSGPSSSSALTETLVLDSDATAESGRNDQENTNAVPSSDDHQNDSEPAESNWASTAGEAENPEEDGLQMEPYEQGVALVRFKPDANPSEALSDLARESGIDGFELGETAGDYVEIKLPSTISVENAVGLCARSKDIDAVQPNFRYYLMEETDAEGSLAAGALPADGETVEEPDQAPEPITLNDAYASSQWALDSVHAYEAWQTARGDSPKDGEKPVTVAVIDNVIDVNHPDLKDNLVAPYNAVSGVTDDDVAGATYTKSNRDHGTHVAGIVSAKTGNAIGCAGVSHNARVMPIRAATDSGGFNTTALVRAFAFATQNQQKYNVRVINLSVGAPMDSDDWMESDDAVLSEIDKAWDAGIVTVTAACNAGTYSSQYVEAPFVCYPGDYDKCVNVISLRNNGDGVAKAATSNYNTTGKTSKDISAPGVDIKSTVLNSDYGTKGGTSMAAPCVAGILALEFTAHPEFSPQEAVDRLYASADDLGEPGFDEFYGYGEVDARVVNYQSDVTIAGPSAIAVGDQQTYSLKPAQPGTWIWECSDADVASITADSSTATIKGKAPGRIVASAASADGANERSARAAISVFDTTITGTAELDAGQTSALALSDSNPIATWTWTSSNENVASIGASTGVVTAHAAGSATITATLSSCPTVSGRITVTVGGSGNAGDSNDSQAGGGNQPSTPPVDDQASTGDSGSTGTPASNGASAKPTQTTDTSSSNGSASKPTQTKAASTTTATGKTTSTSKSSSASTAKAAATASKVSLSKVTASFSKDYVYNGELKKLKNLKLTYGGKTLKLERDYTVSYKNNRKAGTATAVITGKGNYTSKKTLRFTISRAKNTLAIKTKKKVLSISTARVETAQCKLARTKAFVIAKHRGNMSFKKVKGSKYLAVKKSTGTIIVKKGTPRGTYYVKIKVRAAGTANFKPAALYKTIKVRVI